MKLTIQMLALWLIVVTSIAVYDAVLIRPRQLIAVVDAQEVFREVQAEVRQSVAKGGPGAHDKALARAKQFEAALPKALAELPGECRCIVVEKAAVVGSGAVEVTDLTPMLREKVKP